MFWVYGIKISGTWRYIGMTGNIEKRQKEHNYYCFKKLGKKQLYNEVRNTDIKNLKLIKIKNFGRKVDAKRYECYLILKDYFTMGNLWQRVPRISDI